MKNPYSGTPCPEIMIDPVSVVLDPTLATKYDPALEDFFLTAFGDTPQAAMKNLSEMGYERAHELLKHWWNSDSLFINMDIREAVADARRGIRALRGTFSVSAVVAHSGSQGWTAYGTLSCSEISKETDSTLRLKAQG